jgi:CBS domain-containing protein
LSKPLREEFPSILDQAYKRRMREAARAVEKRILVRNIMRKSVITIGPASTMLSAAQVMGKKHIGSLVVTKAGKPLGIVTERDLLSKIIALGKDPKSIRVRDMMSTPLITIDPKATVKEAAKTMIEKKGHLVVSDGKRIVGVVTASDLIRTMPECDETMARVDDSMTKKVVMMDSTATVADAARMMGKLRIGSVIVTRAGKSFGIFTERDLLTHFLAKGTPLSKRVGDAASHPLITIASGTSVHQAARVMARKHIRRLPITSDGKIVGIITARDLVEAYGK